VNVQINQLTQAAMQDPDKLAQVMELAKKHGLLDRLMTSSEPTAVGAMPTSDPIEIKVVAPPVESLEPPAVD
jgi:hypothetical protein